MLYTYHHKLEDEDVKKKYGAMYDEYRLEKWYKYMHVSYFILRRTLYIIVLVYFSNMPFL